MPKYLVSWEVDVVADSPAHAASIACAIQRRSDNVNSTFVVTSESGHVTAVVLQAYIPTE